MRPKLVALAATVAALLGAGGFLASTSCGCRGIDVSRSPQISGTLGSGSTLTAGIGSWTSVPASVTFQWLRCDQAGINCRPISGATTAQYVQADSDGGATLAVIVTATNDVGQTTSAQSGPTGLIPGLIPVNTTLPAVSGDAFWASTNLTASPGAWTNSPTTFAYQWQDCSSSCANIAGATGQSYIPTQANVGHTLQVAVTARNTAGPGAATSTATAAVGANGPPTITLSGTAVSWPAQPGATSFKGGTSTAPTGGTTTYTTNITSPWTPAAQCGQTLYYGVASEGPAGEAFSTTRLPITWPPCPTSSMAVGINNAWGGSAIVSDALSLGGWDRWDNSGGAETPSLFYNAGGKVDFMTENNTGAAAVASYDAFCVNPAKGLPNQLCPTEEIINEPTLNGWTAASYGPLITSYYNAFHSDPTLNPGGVYQGPKLLATTDGTAGTVGSYTGPDAFGYGYWNSTIASEVDGVVVHPYGRCDGPSGGATGFVQDVTDAHTLTGKPVYITEVGWHTNTPTGGCSDGYFPNVSELQQAQNIYNFIGWARGTGYIAMVIIFNWRDYSGINWWGVERYGEGGGTVDGSKKPSFTAMQQAAAGQPCTVC